MTVRIRPTTRDRNGRGLGSDHSRRHDTRGRRDRLGHQPGTMTYQNQAEAEVKARQAADDLVTKTYLSPLQIALRAGRHGL